MTDDGYAKGRAKRDEIVDIAFDVVATEGYDRASVREIARRAGVSQAGLLHHFPSKEDLFLDVLRRRDGQGAEPRRGEGTTRPVPDRHTLDRLLEVVRGNTDQPGLIRLFVAMSAESGTPDSPSRAFFEARYAALLDDIEADLSRRRDESRDGALRDMVDDRAASSLLIAIVDGLQIQWLLDPARVDMAARLGILTRALGQASAPLTNSP